MIYLLDTSAIGALMRADIAMASWLPSIGADDRVAICAITRGEILFGLERLAPGRRRTELEEKAGRFFAVVPCEPIPVSRRGSVRKCEGRSTAPRRSAG